MKEGEGLTWPQIRYWMVATLLGVGGLSTLIGAQFIPREAVRFVVAEIGVASLIAGILAGLVEPFFRKEFARDTFLASFRYVLPEEFKAEVEKIIRFEFVAEKQTWTVRVEKIDEEFVRVTTEFERRFRNKSNSRKEAFTHYEVEDFAFQACETKILECGVKVGLEERVTNGPDKPRDHYRELLTDKIPLHPGETARIWGKAVQCRRINDAVYETFRVPIVNPEIFVVIDDKEFSHAITFGTAVGSPGNVNQAKFRNHYTLSGVYFPGQFMYVRWWPKSPKV